MNSSTVTLTIAILSTLAAVFAYNICRYFNVGEEDMIKRLIAVKNHDYRVDTSATKNNFTLTRSQFKFAIFRTILKDIKFTDHIRAMLEQADIPWQVDTFIIVSIILGIVPLVLGLVVSPAIAILSLLFLALPYIVTKYKIKKRTFLFTQQLPDALDLLCNALRAGHSLFSALSVIVKEMPAPINKIFKILTDEIAMGVDVKEAMKSLQKAMPESVDLRFFTTVVILQREIGGNLIKLLEILAATIRERFKMVGQLKAQTMQARLSGIIVSLVPPVLAIVLYIMSPEYMQYLTNHLWGKIALGVSIVLMLIGFYIINRITDIEI